MKIALSNRVLLAMTLAGGVALAQTPDWNALGKLKAEIPAAAASKSRRLHDRAISRRGTGGCILKALVLRIADADQRPAWKPTIFSRRFAQ